MSSAPNIGIYSLAPEDHGAKIADFLTPPSFGDLAASLSLIFEVLPQIECDEDGEDVLRTMRALFETANREFTGQYFDWYCGVAREIHEFNESPEWLLDPEDFHPDARHLMGTLLALSDEFRNYNMISFYFHLFGLFGQILGEILRAQEEPDESPDDEDGEPTALDSAATAKLRRAIEKMDELCGHLKLAADGSKPFTFNRPAESIQNSVVLDSGFGSVGIGTDRDGGMVFFTPPEDEARGSKPDGAE